MLRTYPRYSEARSCPVAQEAKGNVGHVQGLGSRLKDDAIAICTSFATVHISEQAKCLNGESGE